MTIPYPVTVLLGSIAEAAAADLGVMMTIAITDGEGGLRFFIRMNGALPASTEIAISKAYTAAVLRMPTREVGRLALPGKALYGIQHTHSGKIILFGGGIPLSVGDRLVGGIGVSGGTVEEDELVAEAAVKAFGEMAELAGKIRPFLAKALSNRELPSSQEKKLWEAFQGGVFPLPGEISRVLAGALFLAVRGRPPVPTAASNGRNLAA
jgi:uncharacterized protein GlcG (DUF336 family)